MDESLGTEFEGFSLQEDGLDVKSMTEGQLSSNDIIYHFLESYVDTAGNTQAEVPLPGVSINSSTIETQTDTLEKSVSMVMNFSLIREQP
jgi:hypothetical protein